MPTLADRGSLRHLRTRPSTDIRNSTGSEGGAQRDFEISKQDRAAARVLFASVPLQGPEKVLRRRFYEEVRERLYEREYGTLEAVAEALCMAPGNLVQPGCDLSTFYAAVGGYATFPEKHEEDWQHLVALHKAWKAQLNTCTPCFARAQALLGAAQARGRVDARTVEDALDAMFMGDKCGSTHADPYADALLKRLFDLQKRMGSPPTPSSPRPDLSS